MLLNIIILLGLILIIIAAFLVSPVWGLATAGVCLLLLAVALNDGSNG